MSELPVPAPPRASFTDKHVWRGFALAVAYGVLLRVLVVYAPPVLAVMSLGYIFVAPCVIGYMAVQAVPNATTLQAMFWLPWPPVFAATLVIALVGWEGSICVVMALPVLLVGASLGGTVARQHTRGRLPALLTVAGLPFAVGAAENHVPLLSNLHTVDNAIDIEAPPAKVWREIVSVREIQPSELPTQPLFLRLGFPRPLSAEIDREAVGGIRKARFAGGVLFLETVTALEPERLLSFRIAAQTQQIPPGTLDDHVTIGGPYFDVLQGTYRLEPLAEGRVRLHLQSRLRVSTHFNWYASLWADAVMASIQRNILAVEKARAEKAVQAAPSNR